MIKQITKSGFPRMFLGIPTLEGKADVSISAKVFLFAPVVVVFFVVFLRRGEINGYLQFVETQSILCGSYPLNGDEGTMTEYGHFRVTADLGRWPLVEVFVLDPDCCVVY